MNNEIDPYYQMLREEAGRIRNESWNRSLWTKNSCEKEHEHSHCQFCWVTIWDKPDTNSVQEGYTKDGLWICINCYSKIIEKREDPENVVQRTTNKAS